jgi:two-component system NtrC family sensor kinase
MPQPILSTRAPTKMTRNESDSSDHLTVVSVAKRQWERTFDAISDPLMIVDGEYMIRRANLALADDLGMAIQRIVGRKCHDVRRRSTQAFAGEPDAPCAGCPVPQARAERVPRDGEIASRAGRLYRLRAYPLDDSGDHGWLGTGGDTPAPARAPTSSPLVVCSYRDVTEEREMTRQLSNAEKLAAIGRLAGGVAHEINNPLGGILAFAQILLRDPCPPEEQRDYLREIEKSAFRCKAIVESLLRFSRQSPSAPRVPLSLNDVVRESLTLVSYKYAVQDVAIRCNLEEALPAVLGNANQLEQVLVNLLSNAFDAITARAGLPTAPSAPAPPRTGGDIEVRTSVVGGLVELEVADSGGGIDEADLPRIFDPFFTTKEEGRGTGLGLAVTYAIVREHGGRIAARNRPGGGALFVVMLPIAP